MTHIDEYRLELLILDPEALGSSIGEINAHLEQCAGCALMVKQVQTFYRQVEETYQRAEPPQQVRPASISGSPRRPRSRYLRTYQHFPGPSMDTGTGMIRSIAAPPYPLRERCLHVARRCSRRNRFAHTRSERYQSCLCTP